MILHDTSKTFMDQISTQPPDQHSIIHRWSIEYYDVVRAKTGKSDLHAIHYLLLTSKADPLNGQEIAQAWMHMLTFLDKYQYGWHYTLVALVNSPILANGHRHELSLAADAGLKSTGYVHTDVVDWLVANRNQWCQFRITDAVASYELHYKVLKKLIELVEAGLRKDTSYSLLYSDMWDFGAIGP